MRTGRTALTCHIKGYDDTMGYGTPETSTYDSNAEMRARYHSRIEKMGDTADKENAKLIRKEKQREKRERVITGLKQIGRGTLREAHGFAKEIRTEGIRSGYKTNRTLQRTGRQLRSRQVRQPRTRMMQYRPVFPPSAGLGERTVIESSQNWVPHLDRDYFGDSGEQRDLIGQGNRDMSILIETPENIIKKKNQQYY